MRERRELFFSVEFQLMNVEELTWHTRVIILTGMSHPDRLILIGRAVMKIQCLQVLRVSLHKILTKLKRKIVTLLMETLGRHHLNKRSKLTALIQRQMKSRASCYEVEKNTSIILPKIHNLNL